MLSNEQVQIIKREWSHQNPASEWTKDVLALIVDRQERIERERKLVGLLREYASLGYRSAKEMLKELGYE